MKINLKSTARVAVACGLGLTLAFGGVAGVPAQAFAAQSAGITINKAGTVKYKVYKLIDGEFEGTGDKQTMKNPTLTTAFAQTVIDTLNGSGYKTGIATGDSDNVKANKVIEALNAAKTAGKLEVTVNKIAKALQDDTTITPTLNDLTATDGTLTITGANTTGYYLVAPDYTDTDSFASTSASTAMLLPVSTAMKTIDAKISTPTIDKQVKDADGTDIWDKDWSDLADAGLVDGTPSVPTYRLTGGLPTNIGEYETYVYKFVDTLPAGFVATEDELQNWGVSIKVGQQDITSKFKATVATDNDTHTSTITWAAYDADNTGKVNDLKEILRDAGIADTDFPTTKIVLEYTPQYDEEDLNRIYKNQKSTLDAPQKNAAHLEFSNNPYTDGTGTTPDEVTELYSFNLIVKKGDEDTQALTGAAFTLTADGKTAGANVTVNDDGTFDFRGLEADVEYTLTETKVPTGYKAIQPIKFKIAVVKDADGKKITGIKLADGYGKNNVIDGTTFSFTGADINASVVNTPSSGIPETGAAGIAGGIVVGGVLIAVSAVTILKQRKDEQA